MACDLLHLFGQRGNLGTVTLVGWSNLQGEQMAERIDRDMDLLALPPLGPVVSGPCA